jgi:hypothetical protein
VDDWKTTQQNLTTRKIQHRNLRIKPNINIMAKTEESENLIGIEGDKALVTLVTCEATKLRRIASYRGKRDNDVSRERSDRRSIIWDQDPIRR